MIISLCRLLESYNNKMIMIISSGSIIIMGLHGVFYGYTNVLLSLSFGDLQFDVFSKILLSLIIIVELYYPIIFLQSKFSKFLGGRKV